MKAIKIIVVTISVLVICFFSIGLFIKDTKYTTEVSIDRPLEEVFKLFNDKQKTKNWIPEIKSVEAIDEKPGKIDSTYKVVLTNVNGQEVIMKEKILTFSPNEKLVINYYVDGMLKKNDFTFASKGSKTLITQASTCKSTQYMMNCMFPFFKSKFKAQDQGYLNSFKTYAESLRN